MERSTLLGQFPCNELSWGRAQRAVKSCLVTDPLLYCGAGAMHSRKGTSPSGGGEERTRQGWASENLLIRKVSWVRLSGTNGSRIQAAQVLHGLHEFRRTVIP